MLWTNTYVAGALQADRLVRTYEEGLAVAPAVIAAHRNGTLLWRGRGEFHDNPARCTSTDHTVDLHERKEDDDRAVPRLLRGFRDD